MNGGLAVCAAVAVVLCVAGCWVALAGPAWAAIPLVGVGAGLIGGARPPDGGGRHD